MIRNAEVTCVNSVVVMMEAGLIREFCRRQSMLYLVTLESFYMESAILNPSHVMIFLSYGKQLGLSDNCGLKKGTLGCKNLS